ncbi:MAG: 16S rRNA (adenine(1518)-N(6)/adenine(1519)-N(6))-dimethyltransferase RsmA [Candidatus Moraniibacteriota bacterium]
MSVKAKKSLGQNFLKDESIIERILAVAEIGPEDRVFEIGPGTGVLTKVLDSRAKQVVAMELDHQLVERLETHFKASEGVSILEGNILDANLHEILTHAGYESGQYKVVANIPYYITAPIIRTLLSLQSRPQSLTLMVQKEVAERLTAEPGAMSLLSLMAQYYSDVHIAFTVPKEAFDPVPKVDSAVVQLVPKRSFDSEEDRKFFRIARAGFAARRKTLANNLASSLKIEKSAVEAVLATSGLRLDIRAQALSVSDWEALRSKLDQAE